MESILLIIIFALNLLMPIGIYLIPGEKETGKVQKAILGFHLFSIAIITLLFLKSGPSEMLQASLGGISEFATKLLTFNIDKTVLNFLILIHAVGFVQISIREQFKYNLREVFIYFLFYALLTLAIVSENMLAVVAFEEIILLFLFLNYKFNRSEVEYESRFSRIGNFLLLIGGIFLVAGYQGEFTSLIITSAMVIKFNLFPFNRNKFSSYTLEMNKGIIEQQFLLYIPGLVVLYHLISNNLINETSILILFYFSLLSLFLTSFSLVVQSNIKNISRMLMQVTTFIFINQLCTKETTESLFSLMSHAISYMGIVAFIGMISFKNGTKNLKELSDVKINHKVGNVFLYILIGSSMALPFTPLSFARYGVILSSHVYEETTMIISLLLHTSLLIISFSIFRFFWYSSYFFKPESKDLKLSTQQIFTMGTLSLMIIMYVVVGIPDLFVENYGLSFKNLLGSALDSANVASVQSKNLILMYTFAHPFVAIFVIYFFYVKNKKENVVGNFRFRNVALFNFIENNFNFSFYIGKVITVVIEGIENFKNYILLKGTKKSISNIGSAFYHSTGFLSTMRPKGINSNLLYAATVLAVMLMVLFSKLK